MMAAKNKRSKSKSKRSSANPANYSALYKSDSSGVPKSSEKSGTAAASTRDRSATSSSVTSSSTTSQSQWESEYAYVFKDLRTLMLVSLGLFAAILLLGFVI